MNLWFVSGEGLPSDVLVKGCGGVQWESWTRAWKEQTKVCEGESICARTFAWSNQQIKYWIFALGQFIVVVTVEHKENIHWV